MSEGRKIYNKIVMDMKTGETLEEDSYLYYGPLALCQEEEEHEEEDEEEYEEEEEEESEEDEEEEEEDEEEEEEESPSEMKKRLEALQARVEELTEVGLSSDKGQEEDQSKYEPQTFIESDDQLDDVLQNAETFNKVLNSAIQTAIQHTQKSIPSVVKNNVAQQVQLQEAVSQFYTDNPELREHRSFVGKVSERIMSENPNWSITKVMNETAKEARKRLKLKQKAESKTKKSRKNPGFAKSKGGKKPKGEQLKGQEKQVADMLASVEK